jgi:glycyl-tRNA synthetase
LSTSGMYSDFIERSCPLVSVRSVNLSEMKLHRVILSSVPGNLSRLELEFFCKPGEDLEWFEYWRGFCKNWLLDLGIAKEHIKMRDHAKEELSHYSKATTDIEYLFPFGWGELWGIADRTDFDLKQHAEHSGENFNYLDPVTNEQYIPYCVEPSVGVDRVVLAFLCEAYTEEELEGGDTRVVMKLHPALAPFKAAVLPLSKKAERTCPRTVCKAGSKIQCGLR